MAVNEDGCRNTVSSNRNNKTIPLLLVYCVSGTLLTLVNKFAIIAFPYSNMLLVMQNSVAVILLIVISHLFPHTFRPTPSVNMTILKLWMPVVLLFVAMLTSSLLSLLYVSVPTVIVMRNLSTLLVAMLEYIILRHKINGLSLAILVGMLSGAIYYAKYDLTFSIKGYTWLCVNIASTSIYQVYIKTIVNLPLMKGIGSIGKKLDIKDIRQYPMHYDTFTCLKFSEHSSTLKKFVLRVSKGSFHGYMSKTFLSFVPN
jgi:drug/metabolite transporter (DMT)-like permease